MTIATPSRVSLRDYQLALSERLQNASAGARLPSRLGLQAGGARWLIDLEDAAEVIPVPPISSVPLARVWFKGVTNVRGNLYSVTDFFALLGGEALRLTADARLVLLSERFRCGAALLVERSLGLRALEGLEPQPADAQRRWVRARYRDAQGQSWNELDVPALVQDPDFLEVSL